MKFNFEWWIHYFHLTDQAESVQDFLAKSILEAEWEEVEADDESNDRIEKKKNTTVHLSIPYNRHDCRSLYGVFRLYAELVGKSLPKNYSASIKIQDEWWVPNEYFTPFSVNTSYWNKCIVLDEEIIKHLKDNHCHQINFYQNLSNWLKILFGVESAYLCIPKEEKILAIGFNLDSQNVLNNILQVKTITGNIYSLLSEPIESVHTVLFHYHPYDDVLGLLQTYLMQWIEVNQSGFYFSLPKKQIELNLLNMQKKLGYMPSSVDKLFKVLNKNSEKLLYEIDPCYRHINSETDLIEEIAGRDLMNLSEISLIENLQFNLKVKKENSFHKFLEQLVSRGYSEVKNFSMVPKEYTTKYNVGSSVPILNPMHADQAVLRTSHLPSLLSNLTYNLNQNQKNVHLVEMGKVFFPHEERLALACLAYGTKYHPYYKLPSNFAEILSDLEALTYHYEISFKDTKYNFLQSKYSHSIWLNDIEIGHIGQISPMSYHHKNLKNITHITSKRHCIIGTPFVMEIYLEPFLDVPKKLKRLTSIFPSIYRDVSIKCHSDVKVDYILNKIKECNLAYLQNLFLKDIYYPSETTKKVSIVLEFYSLERTLKSSDVSSQVEFIEQLFNQE